jgi:hypothetical protein
MYDKQRHNQFQQDWATAHRNCTAIGTTLLAVEYDDKDVRLSNIMRSILTFKFKINCSKIGRKITRNCIKSISGLLERRQSAKEQIFGAPWTRKSRTEICRGQTMGRGNACP